MQRRIRHPQPVEVLKRELTLILIPVSAAVNLKRKQVYPVKLKNALTMIIKIVQRVM